MKLFLIGGMEDLNFNYCYKITYESGETYDRRRNELSVEISKEDYKKIITGVLQERPIEQIEGISDVIDKMTENVEFADRCMNKNGSLRKTPLTWIIHPIIVNDASHRIVTVFLQFFCFHLSSEKNFIEKGLQIC